MKPELLKILACPDCGGALAPVDAAPAAEIENGTLRCDACGKTVPVVRNVPRFVPAENYAANFGFQWNRFRKTQLDSHSGVPISRNRFFFSSEWTADELKGRRVLDVGCGAGRFAEIALSTGAEVVALDYSSAVDAAWSNLGANPRLSVVQGDIYRLPFKPGSFDYVYCFGVLQHTPDVERSFLSLVPLLDERGKLAVDMYPKLLLNHLWPKYWFRGLTKRMDPQRLFRWVERMVPALLPVSDFLSRIPVAGRKLRWAVPVTNYRLDYPSLTKQQLYEWAVLDTFDMFGPAFDQPQSAETLESWFGRAGLRNVRVFRRGQLIGHGER
jgi:SAM-dependent methyltransferase